MQIGQNAVRTRVIRIPRVRQERVRLRLGCGEAVSKGAQRLERFGELLGEWIESVERVLDCRPLG